MRPLIIHKDLLSEATWNMFLASPDKAGTTVVPGSVPPDFCGAFVTPYDKDWKAKFDKESCAMKMIGIAQGRFGARARRFVLRADRAWCRVRIVPVGRFPGSNDTGEHPKPAPDISTVIGDSSRALLAHLLAYGAGDALRLLRNQNRRSAGNRSEGTHPVRPGGSERRDYCDGQRRPRGRRGRQGCLMIVIVPEGGPPSAATNMARSSM